MTGADVVYTTGANHGESTGVEQLQAASRSFACLLANTARTSR